MEIGNLLGLSEPLVKLLECVKDATGVLYEPTRIRRKSKAEGDALLILTNAEIQKNELLQRTVVRLIRTETQRQENIDSIVDLAIKHLPEKVSNVNPDKDWVNNFFEECKDVSDEELQEIWGKILSKEISSPGQTSRRALSILKMLSRVEAEHFYKISCLAFISSEGDAFIPLEDESEQIISQCGISFDECKELDTLGLIHTGPLLAISFTNDFEFQYFDKKFKIVLPTEVGKRAITSYVLTKPGKELLKSIDAKPNFELIDIVLSKMEKYDREAIVAV